MARDFNGSTDRIDYADSTDFSGQAQTFAFWTYPEDIGVSQAYQYFLHKGLSDDSFGLVLGTANGSNGVIRLLAVGITNLDRRSVASTLVANVWQHFVVTWDGSTTAANVKIYKNGTEVSYGTTTNGATLSAYTGGFSIGGRKTDDLRNLNGRMADVARWNRVLSASEIALLAAGYSAGHTLRGRTHYMPLVRGTQDVSGGFVETLDGTAVVDHPRILLPSRSAYAVTSIAGYALAVGAGSSALSGQTVSTKYGRNLSAAVGAHAYTGVSVTLARGLRAAVAAGAHVLSGQAASLLRGYRAPADTGAHTHTGVAVSLVRKLIAAVAAGAYSVAGQAVTLTKAAAAGAYSMAVGAGSYLMTGRGVDLIWQSYIAPVVAPVRSGTPLSHGGRRRYQAWLYRRGYRI
jgi:hypothetical protein